jgi:ribosomal subunit interface protein
MQIPLQIAFRGMDPSPAVEDRVRERSAQLERFHDRITSCRVVVQAPHQHHQKGGLYEVRVDLHVPGAEIVINHEGSQEHAHEDVYVAVRDAFDAAERKLEDHVRRHDHRKKVPSAD